MSRQLFLDFSPQAAGAPGVILFANAASGAGPMYSGTTCKLPDDFAGKRIVLRNYKYKLASGYESPTTATGYFAMELLANNAVLASNTVSMLRTYVDNATPSYGMYTYVCLPYATTTAHENFATWVLPNTGALTLNLKLFNMPHGQVASADNVAFEYFQLWFDVYD